MYNDIVARYATIVVENIADLRKENARLKEMVADLVLHYDIVKKSLDLLD